MNQRVSRTWFLLRWILWWQLIAPVCRLVLKPRQDPGLVRLGERSGAWLVPASAVQAGSIAYLGGAGDDISFDLDLWRRGFIVRTFDPTPLALDFLARTAPQDDPHFTVVPKGWWSHAGVLSFYVGVQETDVSFSVTNMFETSRSVDLPVDTIAGCMRELGDEHVDLVKLDIEGAEKIVLDAMLTDGRPRPPVICVEFDWPFSGVVRSVKQLRRHGYRLAAIDGWNYTWVSTNTGVRKFSA